jgi:CIC family chloride channel protein
MDSNSEVVVESAARPEEARRRLVALGPLSLVVGAVVGLVAAAFRLTLQHADRLRDTIIVWAHGQHLIGLLIVIIAAAVLTGFAAWLVRRFSPQATGSGIPHVEAELEGRWSGNPWHIIPVKFVGGLLAIGTGLALGREGPSVQMGASLAHLLGRLFKRNEDECKALLAAGAGAGLATAFNSPVAGAVFVLEELARRFDLTITIATLGASAGAIAVARAFLGQAPDFHVLPSSYPGLGTIPVHLALGVIAGLVGVAYNRTILGALAATESRRPHRVELNAALIGAVVGLIAWFAPNLVGGGDSITQQMVGGTAAIFMFGLVFLVRFGLGAISYAARTPGGLFAPMLVLGSQSGLLFGTICCYWLPGVAGRPSEYAIVGIAAFFTAVVRAPLTGIVLAIELTGSFTLLLPMLAACFAAMLIPTLLGAPPIYDSLRDRSASLGETSAGG